MMRAPLLLNRHYPENVSCACTANAEITCIETVCCIEQADSDNWRMTYEPRSGEARQ